jgi:hypothetical protein
MNMEPVGLTEVHGMSVAMDELLPDLENVLSKYTASGSACLSVCMIQAFVST